MRQVCPHPLLGGPAGQVFPWLISNMLSKHLREGDSGRRSLGKLSTEVKGMCFITQVWVYVLVGPCSAGGPWPSA